LWPEESPIATLDIDGYWPMADRQLLGTEPREADLSSSKPQSCFLPIADFRLFAMLASEAVQAVRQRKSRRHTACQD
jgi:hypothetical protein